MPWEGTDDGAESNPRVMRLERGNFMTAISDGDPYVQRMAAWGCLSLLGSWSARHFTDLFFPEVMVRRVAGPHAEWVVKTLQSAGLLAKKQTKNKDGDAGWQYLDNGDQLIHVLSREQVEQNKKKGVRNSMEVAVRLRDGDVCRYCGRAVKFAARQGWMRGTYLPEPLARQMEHPDPDDRERVVVACGRCNQVKGEQTPEEWGHRLLPVPEEPLYNADTLGLFKRHHITDLPGERERILDWLGDGSGAALVRAAEAAPATNQGLPIPSAPGSGRVSGRDGAGRVGDPGSARPGPGVVPPPRDDGNVRPLRPAQPSDDETPEAG